MTSTSSKFFQIGRFEVIHSDDETDRPVGHTHEAACSIVQGTALTNGCATVTLQMKAFAGQCQFQAPVADDFARGMLAPGHSGRPGVQAKQPAGAWEALAQGLIRWWRGQRSD